MKFLLTVCVFLLTVSSSRSENITVTGTEGRQVEITCPYIEGNKYSYKYFYKGVYSSRTSLIESDGIETFATNGRFSLRDKRQRSFIVTISHLRMEDAGTYGCKAGYGIENYHEIHLDVIRAPETTRAVQISTSTIHPFTTASSDHTSTGIPGAVVVVSVLLVLILCSVTSLILSKRNRKRKRGTATNVQHNTETDRMYEIPNTDFTMASSSSNKTPASVSNKTPASVSNQTPASVSNQTPASVSNQTPASVSNQTPASHLNSDYTVYPTVTNQQPDSNPSHTHLTYQVTDTDFDFYANIKSPEATQYSRTELIYPTATQNITTDDDPLNAPRFCIN